MDEFRRTIVRRGTLVKIIEENVGELGYNNEPIGYCFDSKCEHYRTNWHDTMKEGMIDNIKKIRRALDLIEKSIENSEKITNIKN
jgi:hypothetical protein